MKTLNEKARALLDQVRYGAAPGHWRHTIHLYAVETALREQARDQRYAVIERVTGYLRDLDPSTPVGAVIDNLQQVIHNTPAPGEHVDTPTRR